MAPVRELTDAEVKFFRENGWAFLPGFVNPDAIAKLAACAESRIATEKPFGAYKTRHNAFGLYRRPDQSHESARAIALSTAMGRNAARLMLGARAVRLIQTTFLVKSGRGGERGGPTGFHQDFPAYPFDRSEMANFWISINGAAPQSGAMRFYSGSHKLGSLGKCFIEPGDETQRRYPQLEQLELSPALTLAPGDATVHHGLTAHGAPENTTERHRIAMSMTYFDAATRYTGAPFPTIDNRGLKIDGPFDHPDFPLIEAGEKSRSQRPSFVDGVAILRAAKDASAPCRRARRSLHVDDENE